MFSQKKNTLFRVPATVAGKAKETANPFLAAAGKYSAQTTSGNYAAKYSTTGNDFLDQFANAGNYRKERKFEDVSRDCVTLWHNDPVMSVRFILYLRTISRQVALIDGTRTEKVQKGQGLKHESIMRMLWLAIEHPDAFWANIGLFIAVGSWKDIFQMLRYDLEYHGWQERALDWPKFASLFQMASTNETQVELFKKYMPQIQAKSKCKTLRSQARTIVAKWLANILGVDYKGYRLLKSSGTAHTWQQLISRGKWKDIDFDSIHGRALLQLTSSKFLENKQLVTKYDAWIAAQPVAKFTGYVHELAMKIGSPNMCGGRYRYGRGKTSSLKPYQKATINKQYDGLVQLAKKDGDGQSSLLVVRDTSSSMTSSIPGQDFSAYDVAKALGIFFGDMLEGPFKNTWLEFSDNAQVHTYTQDNFVDKWLGDTSEAYGGTNFQAVTRFLCAMRKKGVGEEWFPGGILCISDGEFNRTGMSGVTNVVTFKKALTNAGFSSEFVSNFKIVFWDIPNGYYGRAGKRVFETYANHDNVFYLSGYDGTTVSFLLGGSDTEKGVQTPRSAEELFAAAMDQEVLNMVSV